MAEETKPDLVRSARRLMIATWLATAVSAAIAIAAVTYPLYLRHLDNAKDFQDDMTFLEGVYPNVTEADKAADSEKNFPIAGDENTDWAAVETAVNERLENWQTQRVGVGELSSQIWRMPNSARALRPIQCLINAEINAWSSLRLVARLHQQKAPPTAINGIAATAMRSVNDRAPCIARVKATINWLTMPDGALTPRPIPIDICSIKDFADFCQATIERYKVPMPAAQ